MCFSYQKKLKTILTIYLFTLWIHAWGGMNLLGAAMCNRRYNTTSPSCHYL